VVACLLYLVRLLLNTSRQSAGDIGVTAGGSIGSGLDERGGHRIESTPAGSAWHS
jgi:hypothetical protein